MHLHELIPWDELAQMLDEGYVSRRKHPTKDLWILNYTAQAQYANLWNESTMNCRGLIHDENKNIVARPFKKFFNLGQDTEPGDECQRADIPLHTRATAYDKMDGSLGIIFYFQGEWDIATRGSFESDQAKWARSQLSQYVGADLDRSCTYLVEIIYPENRIVCDYGDRAELVLLDVIHTSSGTHMHHRGWDGPIAARIAQGTLEHILSLPPRPGAEGLVLHIQDHGMWKLKQEDYVRLHRIVFGLTERKVWEALAISHLKELGMARKPIGISLNLDLGIVDEITSYEAWAADVPDEFRQWLDDVNLRLTTAFMLNRVLLKANHSALVGDTWSRKEYVECAKTSQDFHKLLALYDHKDARVDAMLWKDLYPEHRPLRVLDEATA